MNSFLRLGLIAIFASAMYAQVRTPPSQYGSPTGFGSVLYPGTGHAPTVTYPTLAGTATPVRPGGNGVRGYVAPPPIAHPAHGRRVVVPYPVYVGGYYGGGYYTGFDAPPPGYQDPQYAAQPVAPPVVIINQAYRPDTVNPVVRDYSDTPLPEPGLRSYQAPVHPMPDPSEERARRAESERPTIYLIAFKDHTILPALAYWMEGDTLNYVTQNGTPNRASLDLIDRDFSKQLNRERNVEFTLP